jgi:hypothetical protein
MMARAENDLRLRKDFGPRRKSRGLPHHELRHNFIDGPVYFQCVWSTNYPNLSR